MVKALVAVTLAILCAGIGNIFLSKGMHLVGALENYQLTALAHYFWQAFTNPWVILGIFLELTYFLLWLAVLSWADVSWAVPMNALEYIFVAFLSIFLLGEEVVWNRWVGILFISSGIIFMLRSWDEKEESLPVLGSPSEKAQSLCAEDA